LVSLAMTAIAVVITTTVDSTTQNLLRVPRRLRVAVRARREAWGRRTRPNALATHGRAVAFTHGAAKARHALRRRKARVNQ
jgi:hypothetical protein